MKTVTVSAGALQQLLEATTGSPHLIREIQATRRTPFGNNPIDVLIKEYNEAADAFNTGKSKLEPGESDPRD